jgi:hypothetical protein
MKPNIVPSPKGPVEPQEGAAGSQDNLDELAACCQRLRDDVDAIEVLERLPRR